MYDHTNRPTPYSAKGHKIDAIKAVRAFCQGHFGATPGLKVTKDLVEDLADVSDYEVVTRQELAKYTTDILRKEIERRGPAF